MKDTSFIFKAVRDHLREIEYWCSQMDGGGNTPPQVSAIRAHNAAVLTGIEALQHEVSSTRLMHVSVRHENEMLRRQLVEIGDPARMWRQRAEDEPDPEHNP